MFYNYLIFNMVTLSLRILLKYCVSLVENVGFCGEKPKSCGTVARLFPVRFSIRKERMKGLCAGRQKRPSPLFCGGRRPSDYLISNSSFMSISWLFTSKNLYCRNARFWFGTILMPNPYFICHLRFMDMSP